MKSHYHFRIITKDDLMSIQKCQTLEDFSDWMKQHADISDSGKSRISDIGTQACDLKGNEDVLFHGGPYRSLFTSCDLNGAYVYNFPIVYDKNDLFTLIANYQQKAAPKLQSLIDRHFFMDLTSDREEPTLSKKDYISQKLNAWRNDPNNGFANVNHRDREYVISELIRLYKTIDWDNNVCIVLTSRKEHINES